MYILSQVNLAYLLLRHTEFRVIAQNLTWRIAGRATSGSGLCVSSPISPSNAHHLQACKQGDHGREQGWFPFQGAPMQYADALASVALENAALGIGLWVVAGILFVILWTLA